MPYLPDPFGHDYADQGVNDLIVTIKHAAEKQKNHAAFQGELSEYVSRTDRLMELAHSLEIARDAAIGHDPVKVAEQDALMALGVKALRFNANHVAMVSLHRNDPSILQEAGYEFKQHQAGKTKVNLLDLVPDLSVKHGPVPGSLIVVVKRAKYTASLELQMTENPNDDQSWRATGEGTYNRSRIELRGLEPARRIYFRARYHEDGAAGRWTSPIAIIVL